MLSHSPDRSADSRRPLFNFAPFVAFWREHMDRFAEDLYREATKSLPTYARLPRADLIESIEHKARLWQNLLESGDLSPVLARTRSIGEVRANAHAPLVELVATNDFFRDHVWQLARRFYGADGWPADAMEQVEHWMRLDRNEAVATYSRVLQEAWDTLVEREQVLEEQRQVIQELSTPIVSIHAGIVLLPLVGHIDERRAMQILEATLERIVELQAEILILDITGVPLIDATVAHELLKLAQTVSLIGTQMILVGMGPDIAKTVIELGVDLQQLSIRADLAAGIRYALACRGYAIHAAS